MKKTAVIATVAAFAIASPALAKPPRASAVDRVIAKATAAMGGLDRIHAIRSLVFRGFHYEGSYHQEYASSFNSNAVMARLRPGLRLVGCRPEIPECDGKWGRILEGYDGTRGWELNWQKQRLVRTVNKAEIALRCGAEFDFLFIDYKARGFTATYIGERTMLGRNTIAVQIDQQGCSSAIYYFDPATYRLEMLQLRVPVHARGDLIDTVAVYREFTTVDGVRLPSRSEEVSLKTGEVLGGGAWTSITANTLRDDAAFSAPAVTPPPITATVLDMLAIADKADPPVMMARYDTFRASADGKDLDTAYDLNWLGYELLKVDKYPAAIAVFERVIVEHPQSAGAYDSLGDAYLQKGDSASAASAFDKALAIDPKSDTVRKKRTKIGS